MLFPATASQHCIAWIIRLYTKFPDFLKNADAWGLKAMIVIIQIDSIDTELHKFRFSWVAFVEFWVHRVSLACASVAFCTFSMIATMTNLNGILHELISGNFRQISLILIVMFLLLNLPTTGLEWISNIFIYWGATHFEIIVKTKLNFGHLHF
jgi:hypothetical protein